jgi:hypothetical protein
LQQCLAITARALNHMLVAVNSFVGQSPTLAPITFIAVTDAHFRQQMNTTIRYDVYIVHPAVHS